MYDNLNMIYVEIPKLQKTKEELSNHLEWWLYIFQNLNRLQEMPKAFRGDVIERVFDKAEFINMPKKEQDKYHKNLKVYRDLFNSFDTMMKDGFKQGMKKGMEKGIEKGIKEEKIKIAKKLLKLDMDIDFIVESTGLSKEEIESI